VDRDPLVGAELTREVGQHLGGSRLRLEAVDPAMEVRVRRQAMAVHPDAGTDVEEPVDLRRQMLQQQEKLRLVDRVEIERPVHRIARVEGEHAVDAAKGEADGRILPGQPRRQLRQAIEQPPVGQEPPRDKTGPMGFPVAMRQQDAHRQRRFRRSQDRRNGKRRKRVLRPTVGRLDRQYRYRRLPWTARPRLSSASRNSPSGTMAVSSTRSRSSTGLNGRRLAPGVSRCSGGRCTILMRATAR